MIAARLLACLAAAALISGCAAPRHLTWERSASGDGDLREDIARCNYESSAATQTTDYSYRSGIGQELDRAIRRRDLGLMCMRARGWTAQGM